MFRKINRIGAERFSREAELLADLAANDITAEARSLYNPWSYYCQTAFRDLPGPEQTSTSERRITMEVEF